MSQPNHKTTDINNQKTTITDEKGAFLGHDLCKTTEITKPHRAGANAWSIKHQNTKPTTMLIGVQAAETTVS